jgi:hypothetical protein
MKIINKINEFKDFNTSLVRTVLYFILINNKVREGSPPPPPAKFK